MERYPAFEETCWHQVSAYLVYGRPQRRLGAIVRDKDTDVS